MDNQFFIGKIRNLISNYEIIEFAYIFGSLLKNNNFRDIDIAVYLNQNLEPYEEFRLEAKLAREIEKKIGYQKEIDIKVLNSAPITFQYEVISKGRVIFVRDEKKRIRYECETISDYLDYKEVLDFHNKKFLERL